jgi:hypothetical protein
LVGFGYTLTTEQSGPKDLVRYAVRAEEDVALVQVGDALRQEFLDKAAGPLLDKLRALAP